MIENLNQWLEENQLSVTDEMELDVLNLVWNYWECYVSSYQQKDDFFKLKLGWFKDIDEWSESMGMTIPENSPTRELWSYLYKKSRDTVNNLLN